MEGLEEDGILGMEDGIGFGLFIPGFGSRRIKIPDYSG